MKRKKPTMYDDQEALMLLTTQAARLMQLLWIPMRNAFWVFLLQPIKHLPPIRLQPITVSPRLASLVRMESIC